MKLIYIFKPLINLKAHMIPRIIHYCWFGRGPKSELGEKCIASWKKYLPDYEFMEWNEDTFDLDMNPFVKQAYEQKNWVFVADYVRVWAVHKYGGFNLDTDMEVRKSLNELLDTRCICSFEMVRKPFSAFFGAEPGHPFVQDMKETYDALDKYKQIISTETFDKILIEKYGADPEKDEIQQLKEGIILYPSNYFSADVPINFVVHHYEGNWLEKDKFFYSQFVNSYEVIKQFTELPNSKETIKHLVYHQKIFSMDQILDQIPLSFIVNYVKKKFLGKIGLK